MSSSLMLRRLVVGAFLAATFVGIGAVIAAEMTPAPLNPAAINIQLPKDIKWKETEAGSATYVVAGDPTKPGFYAVLTKWHAGHSSRPHFHQNDRYIQVLSGTWWVGTGAKFDPDHDSRSGWQLRYALWQADPLRRRQGRRYRIVDHGPRPRRLYPRRSEIESRA